MPAKTNYLQNKLIDALYRGIPYTFPSTIYIALYTATPNAAGGGTEVSGGGYARTALNPSTTNWAATNAQGSVTNPSTGTSGTTSNNVPITFPTSTASWGTVTSFATFDALSGNMLEFGTLTSPATIPSGVTPTFGAGALVLSDS